MWKKGFVEWTEGKTAFLSVVFSWLLQKAYQRAVWYASMGYHVRAGGPAVILNPGVLNDVAEVGGEVDALLHHNQLATFTSRGCVNKCKFCAVPTLEGNLIELDNWPVRPIICDNNLTACSITHFDSVIDKLLEANIEKVDFNQGLDARLLTEHHAIRIAELHRAKLLSAVRLAWDNSGLEPQFKQAYRTLRKAGIPANLIKVYCLIGFNDTPQDALYRLNTIYSLGSMPNPMRYQPLDSVKKNCFVNYSSGWTHKELQRFMRYWSNLSFFGSIPFNEFTG